MKRTKTIYEVLYDAAPAGPAGDGTHVARFGRRKDADNFAAASTCYGRPATVQVCENVPAHLAARWGV